MQIFVQRFDENKIQNSDFPYFLHKKAKKLMLSEHYHLDLDDPKLTHIEENHGQKSDFFSASYSDAWMILAFDQEKVGVDIELLKPRNPSLLQKWAEELTVRGENNREGFCRLRTAKEALLKALNLQNLDLIDHIKLIDIKNTSEVAWEVHFNKILTLRWSDQCYELRSFKYQEIIGAVWSIPHL